MELMSKVNTVPYSELLRPQSAKANLFLGMLGRLPVSTAGVAILIAFSASSSSSFFPGAATALYVLMASIVAPFWSRKMDVFGHRVILQLLGLFQGSMWLAFAFFCTVGANDYLLVACCFALGTLSLDVN
jgi:MFS family permease